MSEYLQRLPPSVIEQWVFGAISRFAVLAGIGGGGHYSSTLVAIMVRLDYKPAYRLLARHGDIAGCPPEDSPVDVLGYTNIVQKHISEELLEDLQATLELAESDSRVEVLTMRDSNGQLVEGAVFVSEDGRMSYTSHGDEPLDVSKDRGDKWGAW